MNVANKPPNAASETERLTAAETALFLADYQKYSVAGESKPQTVGMPVFLHAPQTDTGVLLIHGLMAAPAEVRQWADFLHAKGLTVYAPRLAGHGTSAEDLARRSYNDWLVSVNRGHDILKTCCKKILVAGFSTGAGLALQMAIAKPHDFEAVISISAPFKFASFSSRFAELLNAFNHTCNHVGLSRLAIPYMKNNADNPHINYLRCPVSAFVQVKSLMRQVRRSLPDIAIPALILQANRDPKVDPASGPAIFKRLGSQQKHFAWIDYHLHGIVLGDIAVDTFREVEAFLKTCNLIKPTK